MIKLIAAARRRPGMTRAEYLHHLRHVHAQLVLDRPLGLRRYVQNHVDDYAFGEMAGTNPPFVGRDSVVELSFADPDAVRETLSHPYTREVIAADGANFSDLPAAIALMARVETIAAPAPGAGIKILHFVKLGDGVSADRLGEAIDRALAATPGFAAVLRGRERNVALPPPPGSPGAERRHFGGVDLPVYDEVDGFWIDEAAGVDAFRAYEAALHRAIELDPGACFFTVGREIVILDRDA